MSDQNPVAQTIARIRLERFASWLACGESGASSEAIVANLTAHRTNRWNDATSHPYDPSDLRGCVKLLDQHQFAMADFKRIMPTVSPTWARLVERWDELTSLLAEEIAEGTGEAPRTYALMREIRGAA